MIGLLLVAVAIILAVEMKSLLIGEAATPRTCARSWGAGPGAGVGAVIHLQTLHLGPEELLVAAKIAVRAATEAEDVAEAIDAAERPGPRGRPRSPC